MKKLLMTAATLGMLATSTVNANDLGQLYTQQAPVTPNVQIPIMESGPNGSAGVSVGVTSNGSAPTISGFGVSGSSGGVSGGVGVGTGGSVTVQGGYGGVSGSITNTPIGPSVSVGFGGEF